MVNGMQMELEVPSVQYCAGQMAYSPRYLGDVIHKSTGGTAFLLGFEFPHHFTRLFKKVTGITPTEFLGK